MRGFGCPKWNKLVTFLLISAFPSTVRTSYILIPFSYCLAYLTSQNKKLLLSKMFSVPLWISASHSGERKTLTLIFWRYLTVLSGCWAESQLKTQIFCPPFSESVNLLQCSQCLTFYSELLSFFPSFPSYYIMSELWFVFLACVLIAVELWSGALKRLITGGQAFSDNFHSLHSGSQRSYHYFIVWPYSQFSLFFPFKFS